MKVKILCPGPSLPDHVFGNDIDEHCVFVNDAIRFLSDCPRMWSRMFWCVIDGISFNHTWDKGRDVTETYPIGLWSSISSTSQVAESAYMWFCMSEKVIFPQSITDFWEFTGVPWLKGINMVKYTKLAAIALAATRYKQIEIIGDDMAGIGYWDDPERYKGFEEQIEKRWTEERRSTEELITLCRSNGVEVKHGQFI